MSDVIKWAEISDKDKVGLLAEKLGFDVYWHEQSLGWRYASGADYFDPLYNLNDTWLVVERVTRLPQSLEEAAQAANVRFGSWWDKAHLWASTAEEAASEICVNALRAAGIKVVV